MPSPLKPAPLAFKPDIAEADRHWQAFFAGDLLDRPVVCVTAPRDGGQVPSAPSYRDKALGDPDECITRILAWGEALYWGGEAVPNFHLSFGPDEIAVFCGAGLGWSEDSGDTNWSIPNVEDWVHSLPLRLQEDHPLWQKMLALYRRAAERMAGKMLYPTLDLHTNMDLLAALRGPQRLAVDLLDQPELIDRAMQDARALFPLVWRAIAEAGQMDARGYAQGFYSMEGAATLQCDFSCMISPAMFRRWVLPALEEEAEIVKHALYHWDGPGAVVHTEDLCASKGLHALSYVTGAGHGDHLDHLDLLKRVQSLGKAVQVWGTPEQCKLMHRELKPNLAFYCTSTQTPAEADQLLEWFVRHT